MFDNAFMGCFILRELREAKTREFLTLNIEPMSVHDYIRKFSQLSRYTPEIVV